jgi:SHS2 domain-containing protein
MGFDGQKFTLIDHTADLGLRVRGETLERLFENAADAMLKVMLNAHALPPMETTPIHLDGRDLEDLMVRWLGEILYLFEGEKKVMVHARIVSLSPRHLEASIDTIPYSPDDHEILCEIKAVTYHQIGIARKHDDLWEASVIFDV